MTLSADKLKGLPDFERYVFALTGQVFNELMGLQKMVMVMLPPQHAIGPVKDAGIGLTTLMLRTLVGKTFEGIDLLKGDQVSRVLVDQYFVQPRHRTAWLGALERFEQLEWLRDIRNRHAFHYMKQGQWAEFLAPKYCEDAYVVVGSTYGTTFFQWQNAVALIAMMARVNPDDPIEGLGTVLDQIGRLLSDLTEAMALGLQTYMVERLCDDDALGPEVYVQCRPLEAVWIPPFYAKAS